MLDAFASGFLQVFQWPAIGFLFLGVGFGLFFGVVPGLSGLVGMAILLPFAFGMEALPACAFLLGMFAVTSTSDTISSVLLGIPGTASSQATVLDGYPMAQNGEAARAFGAAFTVSAVGGVLGALFLALAIPIVKPLVLSFASPEFFMLGVLALTMVGVLSGDSMLRGVTAGLLGLLVSTVGYSQGGVPRYWFDWIYLIDGIPIVPLVLGLFALPEVLILMARGSSIAEKPQADIKGNLIEGIKDAGRHRWLVLRSAVIGTYIGMLPGLGGSIVDWVAYGHAVQSAREKSGFGKGDVRGVIAPETANNAMKGAALIPTVAFGIPGTASMAILLGAFLILDVTPGPEMLTTRLDLTFAFVWILIIANILAAGGLMACAGWVAKVTFIPGRLLVPIIILFVLMGAWMAGNRMGDWFTMLAFGVLGYTMKEAGWPRPPLILGFILGPIMENGLFISYQSYGLTFVSRPICIIIALLAILTVVLNARSQVRKKKARTLAIGMPSLPTAETPPANTSFALPLSVLVLLAFTFALPDAVAWPNDVGLWPLAIALLGAPLALAIVSLDARALSRSRGKENDRVKKDHAASRKERREAFEFLLWMLGVFGLTVLVGQLISIPLFMAVFLLVKARTSLITALAYAAAGFAILYVMFDQFIHVLWQPSLVFG